MQLRSFFIKIFYSLITVIELQFFLFLLSWPILLWWQLPISSATFLGNIIMAPFLTIQLALCSLMVFCAIFSLPFSYIACCFELVTHLWMKLLSILKNPPFIHFICPTWYILVIIICSALYVLFFVAKQRDRLAAYSGLIVMFYSLLWIQQPTQQIQKIMFGSRPSLLMKYHNNSVLIDSGRARSFSSMAYAFKRFLRSQGPLNTAITLRNTAGTQKLYDLLGKNQLVTTHLKFREC